MNGDFHRPARRRLPRVPQSPISKTSLGRRILRSIPIFAGLLLLTWVFGRTGTLHKLEKSVTDLQFRLDPPTQDSPVVIVNIGDDDYREMFHGTSPLSPKELRALIEDIARGRPAVIGVDIDTSSPEFANQFTPGNWEPQIVWERELREVPGAITGTQSMETLPILGGQSNIDPAKNSIGLPLLIDDADDKVTRRYQRVIRIKDGIVPSFPWAVTKAYFNNNPQELAKRPESTEGMLIRYSGDREGSHRLRFSAKKVRELAAGWASLSPSQGLSPSPIQGKIVLLGGSYLGQDRHDTPLGQQNGILIMANVVETELAGAATTAPSWAFLFVLDLFEAFALILLFHVLPLRPAILWSLVLIPVVAVVCSNLAYKDSTHFTHFAIVLAGLLLFEFYGRIRRAAITGIFHNIRGTSQTQ